MMLRAKILAPRERPALVQPDAGISDSPAAASSDVKNSNTGAFGKIRYPGETSMSRDAVFFASLRRPRRTRLAIMIRKDGVWVA